MKSLAPSLFIGLSLVMSMILPADSQASSGASCASSLISTFTPCMNLLTGSTYNGSYSPTSDCCNSLKSLTGKSIDCLCLVVLGKIPLPIPVNRTVAISLPRACKMSGVPFKCQDTIAPLPAPGPDSYDSIPPEPSISPVDSPTYETPPSEAPPSGNKNPSSTLPSPPGDSNDPATAINPLTSLSAASVGHEISAALVLLSLLSGFFKAF
ncbi:hypothetical protein MLD38_016927 [Melastoma candidum]|uniref:Uncharacterized protein n=1 Tax=Melastoma candidum TaxID=119954 RepID=A0ACB9QS42_9MYRT|nr:hypothetical protein MLD38_016927 [Melastoma candidum]